MRASIIPTKRRQRSALNGLLFIMVCLPFSWLLLASVEAEISERICISHRAPNPVLLLLHKPSRKLHVIKAGRKIKTILLNDDTSTDGYPAGVFVVLREKERSKFARWSFVVARSKFLTAWKGRALVAETSVPNLQNWLGILIPQSETQNLLRLTHPGAILVIADSHSNLGMFDEINLFDETELGPGKTSTCSPTGEGWQPSIKKSPDEPISMVVSERDARLYIFEGNDLQSSYKARVSYPHKETGRHVYVAVKPFSKADDRSWLALSLAGGGYLQAPPVRQAKEILTRFTFSDDAQNEIDDYFNRGVALVVTEKSVRAVSREEDLVTLMQSERQIESKSLFEK